MTPDEFKRALAACKTEEEIDSLCQKEAMLVFMSPSSRELDQKIYEARYKLIEKRLT